MEKEKNKKIESIDIYELIDALKKAGEEMKRSLGKDVFKEMNQKMWKMMDREMIEMMMVEMMKKNER